MDGLKRWIAAYIAMDERCRRDNLPFMERQALHYPAPPKLTLVPGANIPSDVPAKAGGIIQDLSAPTLVCRIVKSK